MADSGFKQVLDSSLLASGTRIACRIEYDGSAYHGWQAQGEPRSPTVQSTLEGALQRVAVAPVRVHCAGRTDAGVHGHAQIVHFNAPCARSVKAWVLGGNSHLPTDIRIHWAQPVPDDFHARFSAVSRRYRYVIVNSSIRPAVLGRYLTWQRRPLNADRMHTAAQALLGEQDFSAFRAAACQSRTPFRCVTHCSVQRHAELVVIDIEANAFLHHMVRNIAGSLMAIGVGDREPEWIAALLLQKDRTLAAETAPADGLYLVAVGYPERYALPKTPRGPLVLAV